MIARPLATVAFALATAAAGTTAGAQEIEDFRVRDTGSLAQLCGTAETSALYAEARQFCYGYIAGAATVYREMVAAGAMQRAACPKTEPTVEEMRAAFTGWVGRNPSARAEDAGDGLLRAISAAYPCPS